MNVSCLEKATLLAFTKQLAAAPNEQQFVRGGRWSSVTKPNYPTLSNAYILFFPWQPIN